MKFRFKKLLTVIGLLALSVTAFSQTAYNGMVKNDENQPVAGVTVTTISSGKTFLTDKNGQFTIEAKDGDLIRFSSVGYLSQELKPAKNLVVILERATKNMSEVVITALGIKKDVKRLGYSAQEVKGEDLVKAREPNALNSLVGKVSGLDVAINQEMLGLPAISLRGQNISLYVVDGMPITSDTWNISPDDIESYTVLKGLAASALYGSRAQNGAILITTKKGKKNAKGFTIEFNSSAQVNKGFIAIPKTQDLYGGGDYQQYSFGDGKGGGINDGDYDVWGPKLNGQLIAQYDSPIDPTTGQRIPTPYIARGKDNLKKFIQAGLLTTNNLSFSSVTDRSNIRMSLSHTYQRGIVPNTKLNIVNFNINTSYDLSSKLKLDGGLNYNRQFTPNTPDVLYGPNSIIYNISVWTGADWDMNDMKNYWQPGKTGVQSVFAEYQRYHNPYFMSYEWLRGHYKTDIYGNLGLTYKINSHLESQVRANISTYELLRNEKMPYSAHPYGRELNRGDYREDRRSLFDNNIEALVKYNGNIKGGIAVNALLGGNIRDFDYKSSFVTTDYLNVPGLYTFSNTLNPVIASNFSSKMLVLSAYGSLNVDFRKYASLAVTARMDKHSSLLQNNNTYYYPSASLATVVSDYVKLPTLISFFKLRTSYATAKAPATTVYIGPSSYPLGYGSPYVSVYGGPTYSLSDPAYSISPTYNNLTGAFAPGNKIDPNIKTSQTSSFESGLDLKFLKNRLGFSATFYTNILGPNIRNFPISQTTGISSYTTNAIKTKLSGTELTLNGTPISTKNGIQWNVLVNWSRFKEVFKDLPAAFQSYQFMPGDRVDKLYASVTAKTPDGQVINNSAGYPVYLPKAQYVGNADPDWSWAINNKFTYKTFSLSFQFDGKVGGKVQDRVLRKLIEGGRAIQTVQGRVGEAREYEFFHYADAGYQGTYIGEGVQISNSTQIQYDPVTGVITNMKDLQFKPNASKVKWIQDYVSSFFNDAEHTMTNKTYAKLREVVITYSVPVKFFKRSFINKVDLSLVGRNLIYFFPSKFKDMDVDQYSGRDLFSENRREYNLQTPTTRSYGVNLNVTF